MRITRDRRHIAHAQRAPEGTWYVFMPGEDFARHTFADRDTLEAHIDTIACAPPKAHARRPA